MTDEHKPHEASFFALWTQLESALTWKRACKQKFGYDTIHFTVVIKRETQKSRLTFLHRVRNQVLHLTIPQQWISCQWYQPNCCHVSRCRPRDKPDIKKKWCLIEYLTCRKPKKKVRLISRRVPVWNKLHHLMRDTPSSVYQLEDFSPDQNQR